MPAARSTAAGKRKRNSITPVLAETSANAIINAEAKDTASAGKKRATPARMSIKSETPQIKTETDVQCEAPTAITNDDARPLEPMQEILQVMRTLQKSVAAIEKNQKSISKRMEDILRKTESNTAETHGRMTQVRMNMATLTRDVTSLRGEQLATRASLEDRIAAFSTDAAHRLNAVTDAIDAAEDAAAIREGRSNTIAAGGTSVSIHVGGSSVHGSRRIGW
nr:hypothetical protein B0A51_03005 [Rachicladosporium sp. CCFEE 5018]